MATTSEDMDAARPATPLDYHRLDSLRSQDAVHVPLPTTTTATATATATPSLNHMYNTTLQSQSQLQPQSPEVVIRKQTFTPSTPPSLASPAFHFASDNDVKRDSAIDHSTPKNISSSSPAVAQSPLNSVHGVCESPSLPSILLQDAPQQPPRSARSNRSFLRKFSRDSERMPTAAEEETASPGHRKLRSFHGIDMDIVSESGLEELNQPEKLKFSNRGSVLLNGKKLDAMIAAQHGSVMPTMELDSIAASPESQQTVPRSPDPNTPTKGTGLKTGRRQPSVHMLQAVMQGSRILSAEENAFSERVRTMYEYGDEKAADWTTGGAHPPSPLLAPSPLKEESDLRDGTPEPEMAALAIENPRRRPRNASVRSPNSGARMSYIEREPLESAGGIEDWDALPPGSVDRYGFIKPARIFSGDTCGASLSAPESRPGMQRVSTSLQMLSNSPRHPRRSLFRGPSTAMRRYSRSLPPSRAPSRQTINTMNDSTANSIYSYQSNHSNTRVQNPFRSRDRRALDDAPDMLTLPSYLTNINETDRVSDPYEDRIRRREWNREKKWQEMARLMPIPGTQRGPKGAGMRFTFDVNDPKLVARTWKGIPDRWRATAWHAFLSSSARKRGNYPSDETLVRMFAEYQEQNSADDVQIDVDVPRTISMHIMFRRRYRGGQRLLFRVLHAIALHFPTTGYVQGMAALAATLLCYYDEEMAFVMLVRMWQLRGLEELYKSGFEGLMAALEEFKMEWLSNDSEVSEKLLDLGIDPTSYGTRWYLTLFNMSMPFPAQLRVWDVFMLLGDAKIASHSANSAVSVTTGAAQQTGRFGGADLSVLHATSCAMVEAMRAVLLDSDFENGMKSLTSWVPVQDEDLLMRVARAEWKIGMRNRRREGKALS